jgi:hypothetical protein
MGELRTYFGVDLKAVEIDTDQYFKVITYIHQNPLVRSCES